MSTTRVQLELSKYSRWRSYLKMTKEHLIIFNNIKVFVVARFVFVYTYTLWIMQKYQHGVNQKILVLAHTIQLHYWLGDRERFSVSQKTKITNKIKVKIKSSHGALGTYIWKGSVSAVFLPSFFGVLFVFLWRRLLAGTKFYFDGQRDIIQTSVQLFCNKTLCLIF